jgi:hypothetical protein
VSPTQLLDASTVSGLGASFDKWNSGVLPKSGLIYGIPDSASSVLILDPSTGELDTTSIEVLTGNNKWKGGVLSCVSLIYCVPDDASCVLIIDPVTKSADVMSLQGCSREVERYLARPMQNGQSLSSTLWQSRLSRQSG